MKKSAIFDMVCVSMMAAFIAVCSWITIPFVVPFTLQTFGVFLAFKILGGKLGTISIALYIFLGAIGCPVFHNFHSGIYHIIGPTGGYIIGFLASGITYIALNKIKIFIPKILILLFSLLPCYLFGTAWFSFVYIKNVSINIIYVISICVVPFIIPDIFKILLADLVGEKLKKFLKLFISKAK